MVTEADIAAFERRVGHPLPREYRTFLLDVNGGVPSLEQMQLGSSVVREFLSLNDPNDLFDLEMRNRHLSDHPSPELLYVASGDGDAFLLALAGSHVGEVWAQDRVNSRPEGSNPRVLWHDRRDMRRIAGNFSEFLSALGPLAP